MSYLRVIPRDLFNESKLLKCLGRLCLLIHEEKAPKSLSVEYDDEDDEAFQILQNYDGGIFVSNLRFMCGDIMFSVVHPLNSKENYTVVMELDDEISSKLSNFDYPVVFDNDGNLSKEFLDVIKQIEELQL